MFNSKEISFIKKELIETNKELAMLKGEFKTVNIMLTVGLINLGLTVGLLYFVVAQLPLVIERLIK